jgi:hypothetical protein
MYLRYVSPLCRRARVSGGEPGDMYLRYVSPFWRETKDGATERLYHVRMTGEAIIHAEETPPYEPPPHAAG